MVSSLPVVAQHLSCQIARIHSQRVLHPFKSLATSSKQYQHPRLPACSRRQGEVLPGPSRKSTVTGSTPDALCSAAQWAIFAGARSGARGGVQCKCSLHVQACRMHADVLPDCRLLNWYQRDKYSMTRETGWVP